MGVAKAAALLASPDEKQRRDAWDGIQAAWGVHEEAASAVLNSIAGWRTEMNARRAARAGRSLHFLDTALHQNRMSRASLDAMMLAVTEAAPLARRALKLQARVLGKEVSNGLSDAVHPPSLLLPLPVSLLY